MVIALRCISGFPHYYTSGYLQQCGKWSCNTMEKLFATFSKKYLQKTSIPINKNAIEKVIASSPFPVLQEDESLLFANEIPGGYALWSEDVSKIQQLHREIQQ